MSRPPFFAKYINSTYFPFACIAVLSSTIVYFVPILIVRIPAILFSSIALLILLHDFFYADRYIPEETDPRLSEDDVSDFDLMLRRRSCRVYQRRLLKPEDREEILMCAEEACRRENLPGMSRIRIEYVQHKLWALMVVGASEFLVGVIPKTYDDLAVADVGFALQKVVLHATRMGLGTCWVGGFVSVNVRGHLSDRFNPSTEHLAIMVAIGYRTSSIPFLARLNYSLIGTNPYGNMKRKTLAERFFVGRQGTPWDDSLNDTHSLASTQWAPSACNYQTTWLLKDGDNKYHFYFETSLSRFYCRINIGIFLANWKTAMDAKEIEGRFCVEDEQRRRGEDVGVRSFDRYLISWVEE